MCMGVINIHMYICAEVLALLGPELWMVVSCSVGVRS